MLTDVNAPWPRPARDITIQVRRRATADPANFDPAPSAPQPPPHRKAPCAWLRWCKALLRLHS